ncbi:MAG TPA: ATP-binding protein [Actinomycetota bacterium]|nr:ATP-binding protein [Actinomycetota bacterium]
MKSRSLTARLVLTHLLVAGATTGLLAIIAPGVFHHPGSLVLALVGIVAVTIGLSVFLARSVSGPLEKIAEEVNRVARGRFEAVDPTGPAEARELAGAVNTMAEQLAYRVEELRSETGLREQILGAMEEAVLLVEGGTVVYANQAAGLMLGANSGRPIPGQVANQTSNGNRVSEFAVHHPIYRDMRATSAVLADGRLLVVAQDVTDARRIDRVRRDFVANASHEMKTPVAGILATAETLQDAIRHDPAVAERFAANLAKEATRLSLLIQDLLDLARLDQAQTEEDLVPLSGVVRDVVQDAEEFAAQKELAVESAIDDGIATRGRGQDLALLARNLLENAIRYTPEGGKICVGLKVQGRRAVLSVQDTGIGIPAKDLPRIFERFYRVDKARARETGGTGLGLSIVRHIAESHGGSVVAESELGVGTTFTVSLPIRSDRPRENART